MIFVTSMHVGIGQIELVHINPGHFGLTYLVPGQC